MKSWSKARGSKPGEEAGEDIVKPDSCVVGSHFGEQDRKRVKGLSTTMIYASGEDSGVRAIQRESSR